MWRKKEYIFAALALTGFVTYWALALLALCPPNPLVAKARSVTKPFQQVFFQGWAFFSPPPQANIRLYYIFTKITEPKSPPLKIEVFQDIHKTQFGFFNEKEWILENTLNGGYQRARNIARFGKISADRKAKAAAATAKTKGIPPNPDKEKKPAEDFSYIKIEKNKSAGILTLVNYARILAEENHLDTNEYMASFVGAERPMPTFSKRSQLLHEVATPERVIFYSDSFALADPTL